MAYFSLILPYFDRFTLFFPLNSCILFALKMRYKPLKLVKLVKLVLFEQILLPIEGHKSAALPKGPNAAATI